MGSDFIQDYIFSDKFQKDFNNLKNLDNDNVELNFGGDNTIKMPHMKDIGNIKIAPTTWYFMYITLPSWHFIRHQVRGGLLGFIWGMDIFLFKIPLVKTYLAIKYIREWLN